MKLLRALVGLRRGRIARPLVCAFPLLALCAIAGAASAEPKWVEDAPDSLSARVPGKAVLHLTREAFARFNRLPPELVYLDDLPLGMLPQMHFVSVAVPPGQHCLRGLASCPDLPLFLQPGRTYLARLQEVLEANDRLDAHWLLDDPMTAQDIVHRTHVRASRLTATGLEYLEKNARERPAACDTAVSLPATFEAMWFENPLDEVNLAKDFSSLTGTVTVDDDSIRFSMKARLAMSVNTWKTVAKALTIRREEIGRLFYGGTRFTSANPWISLECDLPAGHVVISFADSRPEHAVRTYDRLFVAIDRFCHLPMPQAAPADTSGQPGNARH
jgi:hypothetical protein